MNDRPVGIGRVLRDGHFWRSVRNAFWAAPFSFGGIFLAGYGDQHSKTPLTVIGLTLFAIGFAWVLYWAWTGFVSKLH